MLVGSSTRFVLKYFFFLDLPTALWTLSYHNLVSIHLHTYRHLYIYFFNCTVLHVAAHYSVLLGVHILQVVMRYVAFHKSGGFTLRVFATPLLPNVAHYISSC